MENSINFFSQLFFPTLFPTFFPTFSPTFLSTFFPTFSPAFLQTFSSTSLENPSTAAFETLSRNKSTAQHFGLRTSLIMQGQRRNDPGRHHNKASQRISRSCRRVKTRNLKLRRNGISENRTIDFLRKKLPEKLLVRYLLPPQLQFYSFHSAV